MQIHVALPPAALLGLLLVIQPAAAQGPWPLRYRLVAGESLVYETRSSAEGRISLRAGTAPPRPLPVAMEVVERVTYRVSQVREDGSAWVAQQLTALRLSTSGVGGGLVFELTDTGDGVRIRRGERTWTVPRPTAETPPGEAIVEGFTTTDAARLTDPVRLLLSAGGQVLQQQGARWRDRLATAAVVGSFQPLLQPFGEALPELPGRPLPSGQEWSQDRLASLPAVGEQYPLTVHYLVGGAEDIGPYHTVRVEFEGSARTGDRTFLFPVAENRTVPMTIESLTHDLGGRMAFDAARGRLVEQHLLSQVQTTASGAAAEPFRLEADVTVRATMLLLTSEPADPPGPAAAPAPAPPD